ncbi:hypothetical protein Pla123a_43280 [Posidoniimonas polymericola]|uniref:Uncharacterized protein n=1 Tax=Posidoniimonas polymericola TaxID=2528002 RepID=A0A5C5XVI3_9BACT|nr:hypothetical protein [Posidoniimonas polymericola]TWT66900.1 hypothetical protein Pla123a_43280 [Posidoniimonas polymericola]
MAGSSIHTYSAQASDALQPRVYLEDLCNEVEKVTDSAVFQELRTHLAAYLYRFDSLPAYFTEEFQIERVTRVPVGMLGLESLIESRELSGYVEPISDETPLSVGRLPPDLYGIQPTPTLEFPAVPTEASHDVSGGEEVFDCELCGGRGQAECVHCRASGIIPCNDCERVGEVLCERCGGTGQVTYSDGQNYSCRDCDGVGTAVCIACGGEGARACTTCGEMGHVHCIRCSGAGRFVRKWRIKVGRRSHLVCRLLQVDEDNLGLEPDRLYDNSDPIYEHACLLEGDNAPLTFDADATQLRELCSTVQSYAQSSLARLRSTLAPSERVVGARVQVKTAYVYQTLLKRGRDRAELVVGGRRLAISPRVLPRGGSMASRGLALIDRMFSSVGLGSSELTSRCHAKLVEGGPIHSLDENSLGSRLQELGLVVTASAAGYVVKTSVKGTEVTSSISVDITIESNGRKCLVARVPLKIIHPDSYADALAINERVMYGGLALSRGDGQHASTLLLIDRRPYESVTAEGYAEVLRGFASDAVRIASEEALT